MNYDFCVMTPWNACQFQAMSSTVMQTSGSRTLKAVDRTSAEVIAEANITDAHAS